MRLVEGYEEVCGGGRLMMRFVGGGGGVMMRFVGGLR